FIPHLQVRHPRVTQPSATDPRRSPCDLHVLGTPPAFTLSQDQTLHHELMLRLIPSGPSIARESPRNLSAKCTPSHCATSDPKQLRDLQHRTSTASHPRRSYSHLFAFL